MLCSVAEIAKRVASLPDPDKTKVLTLATIPDRASELRSALEAALPQFDAVVPVCNYGAAPLPEWLPDMQGRHPNLYPVLSDNSLGDGAKFSMSEHLRGYQFIGDDDIILPPDYAAVMVGKIEAYRRQAVIGLGGSVISGHVDSYYNGRKKHGHALRLWRSDTFTNVLVTCALAFHSDLLRLPLTEIRHANMADIFLACYCQRNRIPMVCAAHAADFLGYPESMRSKWTICGCRRNHDHIQAAYLNELTGWQVWEPR